MTKISKISVLEFRTIEYWQFCLFCLIFSLGLIVIDFFIILGLKVEWNESGGKNIVVPNDVYKKGCISTVEEAIKAGATIGYPIMVKASEGGGGKGI